jgi:hypothetical protein
MGMGKVVVVGMAGGISRGMEVGMGRVGTEGTKGIGEVMVAGTGSRER